MTKKQYDSDYIYNYLSEDNRKHIAELNEKNEHNFSYDELVDTISRHKSYRYGQNWLRMAEIEYQRKILTKFFLFLMTRTYTIWSNC